MPKQRGPNNLQQRAADQLLNPKTPDEKEFGIGVWVFSKKLNRPIITGHDAGSVDDRIPLEANNVNEALNEVRNRKLANGGWKNEASPDAPTPIDDSDAASPEKPHLDAGELDELRKDHLVEHANEEIAEAGIELTITEQYGTKAEIIAAIMYLRQHGEWPPAEEDDEDE